MKLDIATNDGYNIACALRGPDYKNAESLKYLFTAYLRNKICGIDFYHGAVRIERISQNMAQQTLKEARAWYKLDSNGYWHYLDHIRKAARALGDLDLDELGHDFLREALNRLPTVEDIIKLGGGDDREG